jgi:hypothetical protein
VTVVGTVRKGNLLMKDPRKRRCFVISPIGAEGSAAREHADEVYDFIIKPALDACDIEAFRSDHLREPGKISDQMFNAILHGDLCVAVLTGYNPNVFYELAIAQAAARPTIILIEKGQPVPFDIQDLRSVQYDLRLRSFTEKTHINAVIAHVQAIAASNWTAPPLFGVQPPLGGHRGAGGEPRLYQRAHDHGGAEAWLRNVQEAAQVLEVMGMSLGFLRSGKGISEMLVRKAEEGCRVRILFLRKDNPALRELLRDRELERRYDPKVRDIDNMEAHFAQLARLAPNINVRQLRHGCPFVTATRTEQMATVVQHFYSEKLRYCPLWECRHGSRLYDLVVQDFEALWQANENVAPPVPAQQPAGPAGAAAAQQDSQAGRPGG